MKMNICVEFAGEEKTTFATIKDVGLDLLRKIMEFKALIEKNSNEMKISVMVVHMGTDEAKMDIGVEFAGSSGTTAVNLGAVSMDSIREIMAFKNLIETESEEITINVLIMSMAKDCDLSADFDALKETAATKQQIWRFAGKLPENENDVSYNAQKLLLTAATSYVIHDENRENEDKNFDAVKNIIGMSSEEINQLFKADGMAEKQKVAVDAFASFCQASSSMQEAAKTSLQEKLA